MPKAVIFDMDGVLVDSMNIHWLAWREAFRAYNIEITHEEFAKTSGMTHGPTALHLGAKNFPESDIANLAAIQKDVALRLLAENYPAIPGASDLIRSLDLAGWRLAVATSGHPVNVELLRKNLPEANRFSVFVTCEDVTRSKPDPEVFLIAAERLGVTPADAVVIEDSIVGLEAAKRGGFIAVGLTTTFTREKLAPMADMVVDSLYNLPTEVICGLFG